MPKQLFIVVLYKCDISKSQSIISLNSCKTLISSEEKIFVWDNSPVSQPGDELEFLNEFKCEIEYRHTPQNISLGRIYNTIIKENLKYDLVYIFDQDSSFEIDYLNAVSRAEKEHPLINLFLPLIKVKEQVVSPGHFYYFKGKYWKKDQLGIVKAKNNVAVSSGMAIRMSYLDNHERFEERLKLYSIDTNFMIRYSIDNEYFYVIDAKFGHELSDFDHEDVETKLRRFKDLRASAMLNSYLFAVQYRILTYLFYLYRSVVLSVKFKDKRFLT